MSTTPKTGLTDLSNNASQHLVVNGDWSIIDQLLDRTVKDKDLATPPSSPADGDAYIVAASPTAAWSGKATQLAFWRTSAAVWQFITPRTGWTVRVSDELDSNGLPKEYGFDGTNWELVAGGAGATPIQDEGSTIVAAPAAINFVGVGVSVTDVGGVATVSISGGGAGGASPALQYACETGSTADSDPGAGLMKWNNATQASATQLFIDDLTSDAVSMTVFFGQLAPNGFLLIQKAADANTWQLWKFTLITVAAGYVKLSVTLIADGGSFADGDALLLEFDSGSSGGGGLTNLAETKNVAAPNATVPVVSLSVSITEASGDFAIVPKGAAGSFLAAVPDNTVTGGIRRGSKCVDLQLSRANPNQVASGEYSVLVGGSENRATGNYCAATGGRTNLCQGDYSAIFGGWGNTTNARVASVWGGDTCQATGTSSAVVGGSSNLASGTTAFIGGGQTNTASGLNSSVVSGRNNTASGSYSSICGGWYATTRSIYGAEARASGQFGQAGDAQRERFIMRKATTDATASPVSTDGGAASASNQVVLPDNGTFDFSARVVARSGADQASFSVTGLITRGSGVATTTIVGTPAVTATAKSGGASAWGVSVSANATLGCLTLTVTGVAATNIKWVADIETVEVVG